jgi:flagellar hook-length control protein FliK
VPAASDRVPVAGEIAATVPVPPQAAATADAAVTAAAGATLAAPASAPAQPVIATTAQPAATASAQPASAQPAGTQPPAAQPQAAGPHADAAGADAGTGGEHDPSGDAPLPFTAMPRPAAEGSAPASRVPSAAPVPASAPAAAVPAAQPAAAVATAEPAAAAPAPATTPSPALPAAHAAPAEAPAPGQVGGPVPAPAPAPPASIAPVEHAAPLHRAPEAAGALLALAVDRGISRARIALKPAELGGVEIQLSSTAAGVTARLVADSPEAARMLAQAGEELRRSLESRDVTLLSLQVTTTSGDERHEATFAGRPGQESGDRATDRDRDGDRTAEPTPDTVHSVLELPGGLLVDVLA